MSEEHKVHEAEIVGREDSSGDDSEESRVVEHVEVTRIPGGGFFTRSVHTGGDAEELKRSVDRLQLRMWVWFVAFSLATMALFYVAYLSDVFFVQVLLILTGGVTALVSAFLLLVVWGIRKLRVPG